MKKIKKYQNAGLVDRGLIEYNQPNLSTGPLPIPNGNPTIGPQLGAPQYKREFNPLIPNSWGLGLMGAYLGTQTLLNKSNDRNYEAYKRRWIRDYSLPSLIQDPNKFSSTMYENPIYKDGGIHIDPKNKGKFTAAAKRAGMGVQEYARHVLANKDNYSPTLVKRANFARNAAKFKHQSGGLTMNTPDDQANGYFKYPNASSLTFPGNGQRTFTPGPFPLLVKDQIGTQIMTNKPIKTYGTVTELPMFKDGGQVIHAKKVKRSEATIEAEKGELILGAGAVGDVEDQETRVGAGLYKIGGSKHYNGGTPLKAYPGDFVFSNDKSLQFSEDIAKDLVGKVIKRAKDRTPAKLANHYIDLNKFISMAQDEDQDDTSRKTAMLNINNFIDRLAEIAYAQEEQKGFPNDVPDFVKASLSSRFNQDELQTSLDQFKYGGQVKYQTGSTVTDDIFDKATRVNKVPKGYDFYGTRGNRKYYRNAQGQLVEVPDAVPGGTPGKPWEQFIINNLQKGVTVEELAKKGHGTIPGLNKKFGQYYQPMTDENYVFTDEQGPLTDLSFPKLPDMGLGPRPVPGNNPASPSITEDGVSEDGTIDQFVSPPNTRFRINTAEAVGLLGALRPYPSRYPPAFRNYEIQNAKALINASGRPISEQPYLNAIQRSQLGYEQNNNAYGAAGATRGLAAYQRSLESQNQAISQVYNQNIQRKDAQNQTLAQLELQDGIDRITNFEKYDNKLETLAHNKELESKYRMQNLSNITNQMVKDRMSMGLLNQMSDYYQINSDYSIGMKPVYKIENGKLVPYQRTMADLIKSTPSSVNTFSPALQLAERLEQLGYSKSDITRILSRTTDDYDKNYGK